MRYKSLSEVAPAIASSKRVSSDSIIWHLTLDQIESSSGSVNRPVLAPASEAGSSTLFFDEKNVLYSKLRPYLNKVICPEEYGVATTELVPLRPNPQELNRSYLCYYLRSPAFVNWISGQVAGAKMPRVNMKSFWNHKVPLPPLDDQIRIVHLLGKVEGLIAQRKEHLRELDELLKSVFLEMFGDPVRNEKGWGTKKLPQLILPLKNALKRGPFGGALKKEIFVDSGYLVYEQNHALNGNYSFQRYFIGERKYNELIDFKVVPGDILISCSGVYLGKLSIVPNGVLPGIINQALLKISLNTEKMMRIFFVYLFGSSQVKNRYFPSNRGGAIPNLPPMSEMKLIDFICPPIFEQNKFASIVEKVEGIKSLYQQSLAELENLHSAVSQKAFKGELDLSRVPLPAGTTLT